MKAVIKISLSKNLARIIEKYVAGGEFATKSKFFEHVLRYWLDNKIIEDVKESRKEFVNGKGVFLKSLKDLRQ